MLVTTKERKKKTCKNPACGISFPPQRLGQAVCSPKCGLAIKDINQAKARKSLAQVERREIKIRKEKLKSRGEHMREAQQAFNEYVRTRDQAAGHLCISSGKPLDWSGNAVDAGHYRSVGSAPHLRFDERNCHAQSKQDNRFLSGNAVDYRIGLIARIGQEAVDALEADQSVRKYSVEQIKGIKAYYRAKTRELKRAAA
ncbi:recombination protein NinG [Pseudomonas sp. CBS]|uniref:recombination protein NinG n=1 Tax=Pseudomonas sp. CBS TaxID=2971912 RepID=UPI0021AC0B4A|nr:recombination protein NinG [Pseudomonas sp. CBS]WEL64847.1 recombination protein NinG [Pseudomonas sp. CBSPGW29]WEL75337.1 recombination protein NinG [Pseudomonas sp. CBSPAW29]WEL80422.1 recombination protein NinG [Pseudomonas sp. CBSPCAW29]WEL88936.1 recombination protein NinG [Pseudomonas sp. CBSPCBW29]UVH51586.1 recombination protein NinG [Pseudomonas sp. CBS]